MRESDRMRYLVCDSVDTMSRMSDAVMVESAKGISDHLEGLLLDSDSDQMEDIVAASLVVCLAILNPVSEAMLASTSDRAARAKARLNKHCEPC